MDRYDMGWNRSYGRGAGGRGYGSESGWGDAGWGRSGGYEGQDFGLYREWDTGRDVRGYDRGLFAGGYPTFGGYPGAQNRGMYYGGRGGYGMDYDRSGEFDRFGGGYGMQQGRTGMSGYGMGGYGMRGYDMGGGYGTGGGMSGGYGAGGYGAGGYGAEFDRSGGYGRGREMGWSTGRDAGWDRGRGGVGYDQQFARETFVPEHAYRRHPEMDRPQRHTADRWPADHGGMDMEMDDDDIMQSVRQNLHQDGYIDANRIQVEVSNQVVTLTGEVNDYLEARYAWDDAWEAAGVRGVVNQLTVRTDQPMDGHEEPFPQTGGGEEKTGGRSGGRSKKTS